MAVRADLVLGAARRNNITWERVEAADPAKSGTKNAQRSKPDAADTKHRAEKPSNMGAKGKGKGKGKTADPQPGTSEVADNWALRAADWNVPIAAKHEFLLSDTHGVALVDASGARQALRQYGKLAMSRATLSIQKLDLSDQKLEVPILIEGDLTIRTMWITQLGRVAAVPVALQPHCN